MKSAMLSAVVAFSVFGTPGAFAMQVAFDPGSRTYVGQLDALMPVGLVILALLVGSLLIVLERRKARGIWFSDAKKLK